MKQNDEKGARIALHSQAIIIERCFGLDHPSVHPVYAEFCVQLPGQRNHHLALSFIRRALITGSISGFQQMVLACYYGVAADCYLQVENLVEALKCSKQALAIYLRSFGPVGKRCSKELSSCNSIMDIAWKLHDRLHTELLANNSPDVKTSSVLLLMYKQLRDESELEEEGSTS